ncbi:MAG: hypothetical protein JXB88_16575, partial [Spirochaetales bacterium]|nr:hypothetical protein [Spirochaetales bacterium]
FRIYPFFIILFIRFPIESYYFFLAIAYFYFNKILSQNSISQNSISDFTIKENADDVKERNHVGQVW